MVCIRAGFALGDSEGETPRNPNLRGADILLSDDTIIARNPGGGRTDLLNELGQVLTKGTLTPAQSAKLRGKLG